MIRDRFQRERRSQESNSPLVIRYIFLKVPRLSHNSHFAMLSIISVKALIYKQQLCRPNIGSNDHSRAYNLLMFGILTFAHI